MDSEDKGKPIAYLDTGVFLAMFAPGDEGYENSDRVRRAAQKKEYRLLISPVVLVESVALIQKGFELSRERGRGGSSGVEGADAGVRGAVDSMFRHLDRMIRLGILEVAAP